MKFLICIPLFTVLIALAQCDYCHDTEGCRRQGLTSCAGASHLQCDPNCHQCVCADGVAECQARADCASRCGPMHIPYCENGKCRCEFH